MGWICWAVPRGTSSTIRASHFALTVLDAGENAPLVLSVGVRMVGGGGAVRFSKPVLVDCMNKQQLITSSSLATPADPG